MTKPKLIVWGGFWDERQNPLTLNNLNSHASVSCYFLSEALAEQFDVVQISSFHDAKRLLEHTDAIAALSTFQAGFTRLRQENPDEFDEIRRSFAGQFCSIVDLVSLQKYAEDILFTVIPPRPALKERLKRLASGAKVRHMGWCASPEYCRPSDKDGPFTIFLDHGHYAEDDHTDIFIEAIGRLAANKKIPSMRVFVQTNRGVEEWQPGTPWHGERYQRASKVPWSELQGYYGQSDLFCVTHRESAGLGVIEAAMSGATIVIPEKPQPFISADLIATGLPHILMDCTPDAVEQVLLKALEKDVDRTARHDRLKKTHGWNIAATNIGAALQ
jgi:glycosyltransferase involved in cell wall biosynthesis